MVVNNNNVSLQAVVTVTTDLGETFYPADLELVVTVRDQDAKGDIYIRRRVQWRGAARSLPIAIDLTRQDVDWPACVHVAVKSKDHTANGFLPPIVDVWSGSMNPTKGHFESGWRVERRFTAQSERTVSLLEDAGDSIARHLWDGSQALVQHIDQTISLQGVTTMPLLEYALVSATYRRLNVLELGCGCGSVGISVAQSIPDCDVLLTDLPEVTELVEANIQRMLPAMASKVSFAPLDWEAPLSDRVMSRANDLIIVSECTYNTDTLQPLVQTLLNLLVRSPKAVIVLSTKTRHDSEAVFFDMMKQAGFVTDSSMRIPLPGEPGQGYADWATDVGLYVFHGKDHRLSLSPRDGTTADAQPVRKRYF